MSGYGGTGQATLLRENAQKFLFQQETNVTGKASVAVQLERIARSAYQHDDDLHEVHALHFKVADQCWCIHDGAGDAMKI
jgi:hypothetical protein